jgi:hypothetical protein
MSMPFQNAMGQPYHQDQGQMGQHMGGQMGQHMGQQMGGQMGQPMGQQMGRQMGGQQMGGQMRGQMGGQMRGQDQGQGSRLPFQQINPNMENVANPESLLEQRLQERNMQSPNSSPMNAQNPMMQQMQQYQQMPQNPQHVSQQTVGVINIHPAVIQQYLRYSPQQQQQLAQTQPSLVRQIMNAIQRAQQGPEPQQLQLQAPDMDSDDESSVDTSSILSRQTDESSDMINSHSSEEESDHELKLLKTKTKKSKSSRSKSSRSKSKSKHNMMHPDPDDNGSISGSRSRRGKRNRDLMIKHKSKDQNSHTFSASGCLYLSLDFRNDLIDIDNNKYVLGFPTQYNVCALELESCLINRNSIFDREPYIYLSIGEVPGEYEVTAGHHKTNVFGKLIQEKTVNEFIVYKPENCKKIFNRPIRLDHLSISFLKYDLDTIPLNKMVVKTVRKSKDCLKVTTKFPHYLITGDNVNICSSHDDRVSVDVVEVVDVISKETVSLETPVSSIRQGLGLQFEKVDLKCTLTFKMKIQK